MEAIVGPSKHGTGVFTAREYRAGEIIVVLGGPVISFSEAAHKQDRECDALQIDRDRYIDLEDPFRLINHSCEPNAGIRQGKQLIAIRTIQKGEEIFYDYSTTMAENFWTMHCRCDSASCRGIVSDFKTRSIDLQQKYLNANVVMPFIAEKYIHSVNKIRP